MGRRNRYAGAAIVIAVVLVASGCQLATASAGARCPKVGAYAQDGTYVLKCNAKRRWERGVTLAAGQQLLDAVVRALAKPATTTTVPTTAPATTVPVTVPPDPPLTSFGAIQAQVGSGPGQVAPGSYTTTGNGCWWERSDGGGTRLGGEQFNGREIMTLRVGDASVATTGPCQWVPLTSAALTIPSNGDAMYRVGVEIQTGTYTAAGGPGCYWAVTNSFDGSDASVLRGAIPTGAATVTILAGDVGFEGRNCGPWTKVA